MTFQISELVNYVYCIVVRSRLTDVATMSVIEWGTLKCGEIPIACCTEAVCMAALTATKLSALQLKFVLEI